MQLNSTVKSVLWALPVIALSACCSSRKSGVVCPEEAVPPAAATTLEAPLEGTLYADAEEQVQQMEAVKSDNVVYFHFDKYDILPEFAKVLDAHAALLRSNPNNKVLIEGHADERGTPEYNIALGERRANAVAMYLQGNGVSDQQISIVSYGQERPADLGHNNEAYAKNRRAILVY